MRVVNLKVEKAEFTIDRRSRYGNPFVIPKHGDRERVIELYRIYLAKQILSGEVSEYSLRTLASKTTWGCWCKPQPCHGDVLKAAVQLFTIEGIHALKTRAQEIIRKASLADIRFVEQVTSSVGKE